VNSSAAAGQNYLVNGGFDLAQKQTPGTLTYPGPGETYPCDQWKFSFQNITPQYARVDTNGAPETGITARYYGQWQQTANFSKFMIFQPIESQPTFAFIGRTVIFQVKMKSSASRTMRMALISKSTGTVDAITSMVAAWQAGTTDPSINFTTIGSVVGQSVTTAWTNFSITGIVPAGCLNLIAAVWTESAMSVGDSVYLTEAGLYDGTTVAPWLPKPMAEQIELAQRYFQKTYEIDTAPGTVTGTGQIFSGFAGLNGTATVIRQTWCYPTRMRAAPTVTAYSPSSGTSGKCQMYGGDRDANIQSSGTTSVGLENLADTASGNLSMKVQFTCDATM
jgi:hypothetical protein